MRHIETTSYTITVRVPVDNHLVLIEWPGNLKEPHYIDNTTTLSNGEQKDYDKCCKVLNHATTRGGVLQKICNTLNEKKEKFIKFTFMFKDFERFIEFKYTVEQIVGE